MSITARLRQLVEGRERDPWPERDLTCPQCGASIPAYHPSDMPLRRLGLYLPDFSVTCTKCGWHGDSRKMGAHS